MSTVFVECSELQHDFTSCYESLSLRLVESTYEFVYFGLESAELPWLVQFVNFFHRSHHTQEHTQIHTIFWHRQSVLPRLDLQTKEICHLVAYKIDRGIGRLLTGNVISLDVRNNENIFLSLLPDGCTLLLHFLRRVDLKVVFAEAPT